MDPEPKYAYHKKNKNIVKQSREKNYICNQAMSFHYWNIQIVFYDLGQNVGVVQFSIYISKS